MVSEALKPCPFCGQTAWVEPVDPEIEGDSWTQISCGNDQCKVGVVVASHDERNHRAEAIAAWNTRTTDGLAAAAPITDLLYLLDQAEKIALALADAEAEYRRLYQMHGAGDMRTGRAWDKMRQRGDLARAALASLKETTDAR